MQIFNISIDKKMQENEYYSTEERRGRFENNVLKMKTENYNLEIRTRSPNGIFV